MTTTRQKTGGREKGTQNKLSADIKAMIIGALEESGGQEYLAEQAILNPVAFMALLGKILPKTLTINTDFDYAAELTKLRERADIAERKGRVST